MADVRTDKIVLLPIDEYIPGSLWSIALRQFIW